MLRQVAEAAESLEEAAGGDCAECVANLTAALEEALAVGPPPATRALWRERAAGGIRMPPCVSEWKGCG